MAFRKVRTRVANPSKKRKARKHRAAAHKTHAARGANPRRVRRKRRKTNGYAAMASHAPKRRKHVRRANGYKAHKRRHNPDMGTGGKLLSAENIAMVAGAGASTALVVTLFERTNATGKLGVPAQYQPAANAAASAALGAAAAYFLRKKGKVSKFFKFHAAVSGGLAGVLLFKGMAGQIADKVLPASAGSTSGIYLREGGMGAFAHQGSTNGGMYSLTDGSFRTDVGGSFVSSKQATNGY